MHQWNEESVPVLNALYSKMKNLCQYWVTVIAKHCSTAWTHVHHSLRTKILAVEGFGLTNNRRKLHSISSHWATNLILNFKWYQVSALRLVRGRFIPLEGTTQEGRELLCPSAFVATMFKMRSNGKWLHTANSGAKVIWKTESSQIAYCNLWSGWFCTTLVLPIKVTGYRREC